MSNRGAVPGMPVLVGTLDISQTRYSHPKEVNPLGLFTNLFEGKMCFLKDLLCSMS